MPILGPRPALAAAAVALVTVMLPSPGAAQAVKSTECAKIGICYCVSSELKPVIEAKVAHFRALAWQRAFDGQDLGEVRQRWDGLPAGIVEPAVKNGRLAGLNGTERRTFALACGPGSRDEEGQRAGE